MLGVSQEVHASARSNITSRSLRECSRAMKPHQGLSSQEGASTEMRFAGEGGDEGSTRALVRSVSGRSAE